MIEEYIDSQVQFTPETMDIVCKRQRGRPQGSKPESMLIIVATRFHGDKVRQIEEAARNRGVSRSEWIRMMILDVLK